MEFRNQMSEFGISDVNFPSLKSQMENSGVNL